MEHHKISEYVDNLKFQKKMVGGVDREQVYEAIRELSSMYNMLLLEAYGENERLKAQLETGASNGSFYRGENEPEAVEVILPAEKITDASMEKQIKELRRLKRKDLLELLLEQTRENESQSMALAVQKEKIARLERQLQDKRLDIANAGTLAEASLKLNGIFDAAQAAAQQYLDNLQSTDVRCAAMERATKERCDAMKEETGRVCAALEAETKTKCELREKESEEKCLALDRKAKESVDKRWDELSEQLEAFYNAHAGLKELLSASGDILR